MSLLNIYRRRKSSKILSFVVFVLIVYYVFHFSRSIENLFNVGSTSRTLINDFQMKDVKNLRENYLFRPRVRSERVKPLNKTYYSQLGQDEIVDRLLNEKLNGFYVEIGGYDGVSLSNTLFFEEERHWSGLLVEANPNLFLKLNSSGRNAFISNTCLSPNSSSMKLNFTFADYLSGVEQTDHKDQITGFGLIQCFPLQIDFFALNITRIDYFSLDVEGMELEILQQIDFHLDRIREKISSKS